MNSIDALHRKDIDSIKTEAPELVQWAIRKGLIKYGPMPLTEAQIDFILGQKKRAGGELN